MLSFARIGTIALAAPLLLASTPADLPPASDADPEVIQTRIDRDKRMTVPVTIDGQGPFRFMVDTGSQATVVTSSLNEQLMLPDVGQAMIVGMASRAPARLVRVSNLELGSREFSNIRAPVLEERNLGAEGIIGLDSLQDLRVMLDFRDNTVAVAGGRELGGNRGFEIVVRARRMDNQLVITDAEVEGIRVAVIVDTGANISTGNLALQQRIRSKRSTSITSTDVNGVQLQGDLTVARSLKIDGLELNNLAISFSDSPAFDALGYADKPALTLGMRHLRLFDRVAIDFATNRVLFDMPGNRRRPQNWPVPFS